LKAQALQRADLIDPGGAAAAPPPGPPAGSAKQPAPKETTAQAGPPKGSFVAGIPSPTKALFYVFRNILFGIGTGASVLVDGKPVGALPNDHYAELELVPGKHDIAIKADSSNAKAAAGAPLSIDIGEGDVAYAKLEYKPQGDDVGFVPAKVAGDVGRREIRSDCALSFSKKF
jgi:hypothetical protein